MSTRIEYQGKDVYIGIDVHKRTYSVCVVCEEQRVKRVVMPAETGAKRRRNLWPPEASMAAKDCSASLAMMNRPAVLRRRVTE